jgi:hypothetical protein
MHQSTWLPIQRRPLTPEEKGWVRDILSASKEWADVYVGELYAIAKCPCGCRTVLLEEQGVHNPRLIRDKGLVGEMDLAIRIGSKEDVASVLLHHVGGSLRELEVVWYNFPEPVPTNWTEISRRVRGRG